MGRELTAVVWQFCKVDGGNIHSIVCDICGKNVPRGGTSLRNHTTANIRRHLMVEHGAVYQDAVKKRNDDDLIKEKKKR